ncbi:MULTISPECIES: 4'-phosphopantetheinyl transferase superfamily protein [unclassified Carboxylicivirga]|uniref:4'-phosphopantetheinyl transferase superfamily protein n=1 Tax=Carboxylicivirga TaxID=1628153 RepID=UPI003D3392EC
MPLHALIDDCPPLQVAVWEMEESLPDLRKLIDLSDEDRQRLEMFRLDRRRKEWLSCRVALQQMLSAYPAVCYANSGKPSLINDRRHISMSHTAGYAAVCLSEQPTALDIEICSPRVEKVSTRFVHPAEVAYIPGDRRKEYLTVLWSAKETLYKYYDVYGVVFKEQFVIDPFELKEAGVLSASFYHQQSVRNLKLYYKFTGDYTLVYC